MKIRFLKKNRNPSAEVVQRSIDLQARLNPSNPILSSHQLKTSVFLIFSKTQIICSRFLNISGKRSPDDLNPGIVEAKLPVNPVRSDVCLELWLRKFRPSTWKCGSAPSCKNHIRNRNFVRLVKKFLLPDIPEDSDYRRLLRIVLYFGMIYLVSKIYAPPPQKSLEDLDLGTAEIKLLVHPVRSNVSLVRG